MEFAVGRTSLTMLVTLILFHIFLSAQGTLAFTLRNGDESKEIDSDRLLALIKGIDSNDDQLYDNKNNGDKRGQGWAIAYGKRGQKWSMAYGKRPSPFDKDLFDSDPRLPSTKRTQTSEAYSRYYTWNPSPKKRQQGWHIAYGKRSALIPKVHINQMSG